jgi:nucleotide-binding universal stress UspA family protein
MFKRVLVGVDGRSNGRDAVALATRLIEPGGTLTLAHVHSGEVGPLHARTPSLAAHEREASQLLLEQERVASDVEARLVSVVAASPGRGLHQQADAEGTDLLVVGSCCHGVLGRAMLGNDTRGALNGAPCAVAIAPRGYAQSHRAIGRIGVAYNGSEESKTALSASRELAAQTSATVQALEVVSVSSYAFAGLMATSVGDSLELMLEEANARMKELPEVKGRAVCGLAGEELAAFGKEVDILVIGSRSYGPVRRLVLGSTSDYLERHARCALLVLPRAAQHVEISATEPSSAGEYRQEHPV